MDTAAELKRILQQLRAVRSPIQRIKLLAQAWPALRSFDRHQLGVLAANTGFSKAEELLERIARGRGRLSPELLVAGVRAARGTGRSQLRSLVSDLRDPQKRKELLEVGLDLVEQQLEPEPEPEPELEPAAHPVATAPIVVPPPAPIEIAPPREIEIAPAKPEPPPPPAPKRAEVEPASALPDPPQTPPAPEPPVASPPDGPDLIEELEGASGAIRRLRGLHRGLPRARALDVDGLRRLLELFPAGWQRRRALAALLRERIPPDLVQAVHLIDQLESPTARRWCIATVLNGWELEPHEREALIERRRKGRPERREPAA